MKPLFLAPLTATRSIAVFSRINEGYIVIECEERQMKGLHVTVQCGTRQTLHLWQSRLLVTVQAGTRQSAFQGMRWLDLSTQRGPYVTLARAIMTARFLAAQARRAA